MKENLKIPVVSALLFISAFMQAAGYYFSHSFAVLGLSLLAFACSFNVLIYIAKIQELKFSGFNIQDFKNAQLKSLILNAIAVIFFALLVLSKLFRALQNSYTFDIIKAQKSVFLSLLVFIICAWQMFYNKSLFKSLLFCSFLSFSSLLCLYAASKSAKMHLDLYISFVLIFTVLIWSVLSIIKSINNHRQAEK